MDNKKINKKPLELLGLIMTIAIASLLFLSILKKQDRKPTKEQLKNQWKLRDFYLVYQYYFDEDILKLRKELECEKSIYYY